MKDTQIGIREIPDGEPHLYVDIKEVISRPVLLYGIINEIGNLILKSHYEIKPEKVFRIS